MLLYFQGIDSTFNSVFLCSGDLLSLFFAKSSLGQLIACIKKLSVSGRCIMFFVPSFDQCFVYPIETDL